MPKHRVDFSVVVATSAQALGVYDHMRGLAAQAATLNPGTDEAEPAWSTLAEIVDGELVGRRSYVEQTDGPSSALGAGPFIVTGMGPYPDESYALNALAHAEALAQQGAAVLTGAQMAAFPEGPLRPTQSTGSLHICQHEDGAACVVAQSFAVALPEVPSGIEWTAGEAVVAGDVRTYQGTAYVCLQGHTTLVGWEPPNVPALWAVQ